MSSREIAELTGKQHAHVMRDIRAMLEQVGEGQSKFGSTYLDAQGKARECYNLPKNLTINLIAGYRADMRLKIIDRWMELEASQSSEIRTKPKRIRKTPFDVAFERCLRVTAHIPGMDENQRLLMAARGTKELSGVNPLELMGITSVAAPTQDNYLTPTEIGKQIGLSAIATNKLITAIGYQVKAVGSSVSSDYVMTEAGGKYGRMFDTTRRNAKGSQQQLKWSPGLVGILRTAMIAGEGKAVPFAKKRETEAV
nr:Rha family transcriptional regulator [Novacetimonas pomaceti]